MLARDHAIERACQRHDAFDGPVCGLQHLVVVAVDRNVGVHIAVARVHVQRHPDTAFEHQLVNGVALSQDRLKRPAGEDFLQRQANLGFPAGAQGVVLQLRKQRVHVAQPAAPQLTYVGNQRCGLRHPVFQQLGRWNVVGIILFAQGQAATGKKGGQRITQRQLVLQAQLDIDALDAIGVLGHARQRNHHVLVDLEGIGVAGDGGCPLAVEPEFFA